ncbi:MAG: hypothetical protein ACTSX6_12635, partial [Candidatus Heimdallarchaeaceae archaeon]
MSELLSKIILNLCNIHLHIESNNLEFIEFLYNIHGESQDDAKDPHVRINLYWKEDFLKKAKNHEFGHLKKLKRVGRRIWIGENEIIWNEIGGVPGLKLQIIPSTPLVINAYHSLKISNFTPKRIFQRYILTSRFKNYKKGVYEDLLNYLIYFPALFEMEMRGRYVLHASALLYRDKGIIIPGLPGIGKSTLSLAFLSYESAKMLSDNIVLYDGNSLYSFLEPIKLDTLSIELLPDRGKSLKALNMVSWYSRGCYTIERSKLIESLKPDILLIPQRGECNMLTEISWKEAVQMMLDFNRIAGEINSY